MTTRTKLTAADITPAIKTAVNAVLMATAHARAWRERMNELDRNILAEIVYKADPRFIERGRPERITEPKDTFLLRPIDAEDFYAERQIRINKMNCPELKPGHCPALVAEELQCTAEHILIECAEPVFGATLEQVTRDMKAYRTYIDLLCGLVVNLPDFVNPLTGQTP